MLLDVAASLLLAFFLVFLLILVAGGLVMAFWPHAINKEDDKKS
jgi:cbb3-type cytochrome oxidase subunit 3